jgi:hypothetical protein
VCQECGRGSRDGSGKSFDLEPHQIEAARCDAQAIDLTDAAHDYVVAVVSSAEFRPRPTLYSERP